MIALSKLHIAVDMDDTVLDFMGFLMTEVFPREFGVTPDYDGQPWGSKAVAFGKNPLLLEAGYHNWWEWLRERDWLWAKCPAIPGAIGGIKRLRADGHFIEVITSKPDWAEHLVWQWLGKWRLPIRQVTISKPGEPKVELTGADLMVDDKVDTINEFVAARRAGILFDRSPIPTRLWGAFTAKNWGDVVYYARAVAAGDLAHS